MALIGIAHALHLVLAGMKYGDNDGDVVAFLIGGTLNLGLTAFIVTSGVVLALRRRRRLALIATWTYAALLSIGVIMAAAMGAYEGRLPLLAIQIALAASSMTLGVLIALLTPAGAALNVSFAALEACCNLGSSDRVSAVEHAARVVMHCKRRFESFDAAVSAFAMVACLDDEGQSRLCKALSLEPDTAKGIKVCSGFVMAMLDHLDELGMERTTQNIRLIEMKYKKWPPGSRMWKIHMGAWQFLLRAPRR